MGMLYTVGKVSFLWRRTCKENFSTSNSKAATIKLIVSHDFAIVKPTLPPGKKNDGPEKKLTIILAKIKGFYYGPLINIVKHGIMTFYMVNICVPKKFPNFAIFAKLSYMPKLPVLQ